MSPIVTLTFSPAIDKSFEVPALIPDIKLHCSSPIFEAGGGGINVARALKKLGSPALAIYPCGGYSGHHFNFLLQEETIDNIPVRAAHDTRQNEVIIEKSTGREFRFGMPCPALTPAEWRACLMALDSVQSAGYIVVSGSLPGNPPKNLWPEIAKIAIAKKARLVIDSKIGAAGVLAKSPVYLMKPNAHELAALAGRKVLAAEEIETSARNLINRGVASNLLVSMGSSGALFINSHESFFIKAPAVMKMSTVGAGDSMLAGFLHSLQSGQSNADAARYAVACGTAATLHPGTQLCKKSDADRLYTEIKTGRK